MSSRTTCAIVAHEGHNREKDCEPSCVGMDGKRSVHLTDPHIEDASNTHLGYKCQGTEYCLGGDPVCDGIGK
jgi:hypothetical protein